MRGLPAPPLRSRKGLKGTTPHGLSPAVSPLPSPKVTSLQETLQETLDYFSSGKQDKVSDQDEEHKRKETYIRRKKGEIVRRATETLLLCAIAVLTFLAARRSSNITQWSVELIAFMVVPPFLYALYPLRKVQLAHYRSTDIGSALATGLHLPSRFDPGPLLYPVALPVIVAMSVARQSSAPIPINIVCGLSSTPSVVTDIWHQPALTQQVRWVVPILPFHIRQLKLLSIFRSLPFGLKTGASTITLEDLVLIPPLHDALKPVLHYMTTTSLDPSELELLTTVMIDLLILSCSPQAELLTGLLWVGGLSIFLSCRRLLEWEVELARIPKWKFSRRKVDSAFQRVSRALSALRSKPAPASGSSDDDVDTRSRIKPLQRVKTLATPRASGTPNGTAESDGVQKLARRSTLSSLDAQTKREAQSNARHSHRTPSMPRSRFLALTIQEARLRKYFYAAAVYILVLLIIAGPARSYVSLHALSHHEPFGWAIGYMFGSIPQLRNAIKETPVEYWIPLPASSSELSSTSTTPLHAPSDNIRLMLCAYCALVLLLGIITVLSLTSYVEVDTRRKGFHGVMVVMLLPTIFFDPCFFALALALILAAFLLLDLFRASQLPPISRPLTNFLAPYVDGRDHRGPVIVSHIFLLIGCAIPLWLALVGLPRIGAYPWEGWDVSERNVSMVSGVICVGMGDAAASLIGRRYGKTKWYWGGGKSLEGSVAFAVAVMVGLMFAYTWLRVGGWASWDDYDFGSALAKCFIAGSGASLLESVLTAANDNVVVPIGLWLLVRGLEI